MKIVPTVGRVMWFWSVASERRAQPEACIVTHVWGDHMVNLVVFNPNGVPRSQTSVPIVQDESPYTKGDSPYCEWMPYQIGQAKKHANDPK